jgi:hypothetical protein
MVRSRGEIDAGVDERRPNCEKCAKRKILCEYGEGPTQFVDEGPKLVARAAATQYEEQSLVAYNQQWQNPAYFIPRTASLNLPESPNIDGYEEDIYLAFAQTKPFVDLDFLHRAQLFVNPSSMESGSTLRLSVQCLAASLFGRINHQEKACVRARHTYGRALESLSRDLAQSDKASHPLLPSSILALTLYEMIMFQAPRGWVQHAGGLAQLFEVSCPA